MRLGDLDALTGKLKNGLGNAKNAGKEDYAKIFEVFIDWVSREPTIDAVPVVRCRECVNNIPDGSENPYCRWLELYIKDLNFFCRDGQRKIETVLLKIDGKDEGLEETHANTRKNAR